uniref:Uncharacterized protein n=1 Tax=Meloidogyne enterolobii TaxID=390850 RepID=A0A6V7TV81_MELEN|nr:unnamed protein product [Meloidogyne enterolobii]
MLRNKLNLFLLNLILYLLYSVTANDSSEEEYNPEGSEDSDLLKGRKKQRNLNEENERMEDLLLMPIHKKKFLIIIWKIILDLNRHIRIISKLIDQKMK